jgi:hypothetical protein
MYEGRNIWFINNKWKTKNTTMSEQLQNTTMSEQLQNKNKKP